MNACDLFVLPSLQESFGIVQIEAMACGKYIVATSNGGSDEVINSEEYGLLAKTGDPHDLGEKILIALNREYHREAILQYVKRFQWDEISKQTSKIYSSVLSPIQSEDDCQPDNQKTKDKNLLVICHFYTNFEKDAIDQVAKNFSKVFVIVRYNPFAEIARYFPIPFLERYQLSNKVDHFHQPDNVSIFITSVWYAPYDSHYRKIGNMHLQACEKIIDAHRLKFDLIHCHFLWSAGYVGAKLKEKYHVPFIVTAHGYDVYTLPFKSPEWKNKIKFVLDRADFIITVSQTNLRYINELTGNQSFKLIPNGFRTDLFSPRDTSECRRMLNLPQDKKIILTVGRLIPVKGHIYLFEAIRNIISKRQDILCLVIGRGELYTPLNHQIISFGLEKYITLIGGKPHDEIPLWMNACDLFVLPSLNEGNPTVMFETLGCGKPFVGSNVGGVPEVITSDAYGFLVNPADSDDLTEKILIALDREWDQEAILRYADHYTWDEISQEIIKIYKSLLP